MNENNDIIEYAKKERRKILAGKQKTLFGIKIKNDKDQDIIDKYSTVVKILKVIVSNQSQFEAVLDCYYISELEFEKIREISNSIYGEDCMYFFNAENKWNISFGVIRKSG